jgi:hypothetical protein
MDIEQVERSNRPHQKSGWTVSTSQKPNNDGLVDGWTVSKPALGGSRIEGGTTAPKPDPWDDLGIPGFLDRRPPPAAAPTDDRRPAISAGPDDSLDDFR